MARSLRAGWLVWLFAFGVMPLQAEPYRETGLQVITPAELPAEARDTLTAISRGGPFAYERDGSIFGNYEQALPKKSRGYYREYTVKTPGARNRGTRRIVCGPPAECYYTANHYKTFKRIVEQP